MPEGKNKNKRGIVRSLTVVAGTLIFAAAAYCQLPETLTLSAKSSGYATSKQPLKANTKYIIRVVGSISYWRDSVPAGQLDADGGFVFHIPYLPGYDTATVDSVNASIQILGGFAYLPCNGSVCSSVPPSFQCNAPPDLHNMNIYRLKLFHLDQDYLEVNDGVSGTEFCSRTGGVSNNTYWQAVAGNGNPFSFRFHDGDGDYKDNWGNVTITITRLEPILYSTTNTMNFGKVRCNSVQTMQTDTLRNLGSPFFPGCANIVQGLHLTMTGVSGDTSTSGKDGFLIKYIPQDTIIGQGQSFGFIAYFYPQQMKVYTAVIHFITNDPQVPQFDLTLTGEGIQGLLRANPADTLDFGDTPLNITRSLPLSLSNIGTDVLHLTGIYHTGNDTAFTIPSVGSQNIKVNMTIKPVFSFHPTRLGDYLDSVTIASDSYNGTQRTVYLKGRGVAALLEVDSVLDFGNLPVGDSVSLSLPLVNAGNIPFGVQFVRFSAGDSGDFSAEPRTHIDINPGDTLNWQMGFHPQQIGRRAAVAEIAADGGGDPHYVYVTGNGIVFSAMTVTNALDYGIVALGADSIRNVVVRNIGNLPITIQNITLDDTTVWSVGSLPFPRVVPRDSLMFAVTFAPAAEQSYSTTLHITDDSGRQYSVLLTGAGKRFIGILSVPDTLDFGTVFEGDTATQPLPLFNAGNARLTLSQMGFITPAADFAATYALPLRMAVGDSGALPAFFYPSVPGPQYATFEISDSSAGANDGIPHVRDVVFAGVGVPPLTAILAVDTTYGARVGEQVTIPVEMRSDIATANSTSFSFTLRFDGSLLLPLSIAPAALAPGYAVTMNETSPGRLAITGSGTQPLAGTGNLVAVTYLALASNAKQTPIAVTAPVVGTGRDPRVVETIPGRFVITGQCGSDIYSRASATQLMQNVPNPFGPTTQIRYIVSLPTHVTIGIYDALGRKIATLVDADQPVGQYSVPFDASAFREGMYYCRMTAGQYSGTNAMLLMK